MNDKYTFIKGTQHEIFIGIKDQDSYEEVVSIEDFKSMLTDICSKKNIGFSLITQLGGYSHNKGYTSETSLRIIIIGAEESEIVEIGQRLKHMVNTDTIMIVRSEIESIFL